MEKTSAGTGLGTYRRGDVLTDIALVTPGQLLVYESIRFGSVNLCKVTETFKDKYYAIFVNPDNPAEKSKSSDEEFVVYPTDLKQGEYYIALEPSPEMVGEPTKKAKEPKGMPTTPEAPTVSEEAGTPMATPEGAPAVEEAPITGSKTAAKDKSWLGVMLDIYRKKILLVPFANDDVAEEFKEELEHVTDYTVFAVDFYGTVSELEIKENYKNKEILMGSENMSVKEVYDVLAKGTDLENAPEIRGSKKTASDPQHYISVSTGTPQQPSYVDGNRVSSDTPVRVWGVNSQHGPLMATSAEKEQALKVWNHYYPDEKPVYWDGDKGQFISEVEGSKKTAEADAEEGYWQVYSYDIMGGEVNDVHKTDVRVDLPKDTTSDEIVTNLVSQDWLTEKGGGLAKNDETIVTQDVFQFDNKETGAPMFEVRWVDEKTASKKTAIESPVRKQKDYGEDFSAQERIDKIQSKLNGLEKKAEAPSWVPVVEMDNLMDYFNYSNALADVGIACSYEEKGGKHYVRIADDVLADATSKQKITEIIVTTGIGKNLLSEPTQKKESLDKKANDPYVVKEPNLALEEKLPFANLLEPRDVVEASDDDEEEEPETEPELEYEFVYPKDTQESNELEEEFFDDPEAIFINEDELTAYYAGKRIAKITSEQYGSQGLDALAGPLYKWMEREQYWPNVILQGERGNQTVLSINKKGALDDFEARPIRDEEFEDSLGSRDTFALNLFANTEAQGGSDTDGDDGSAYSLLDGRNFSGVNEENAEGVVAEYLDGKAMSLASFEDFAGFVEDIYGISKEVTSDYEDAWVDEDQRKLVACIMDNAVRNVIG